MTDTPRTGLEFVDAGTTDIDQPVNNNALALDAVVGMSVVSATTTAQPTLTSPADDGKVYILPAGRTGTNWGAQAVGTIAQWYSGTWYFYAPWAGLQARAADTGIRYQYTTSWAVWATTGAQSALAGGGTTAQVLRGDGTLGNNVAGPFGVGTTTPGYVGFTNSLSLLGTTNCGYELVSSRADAIDVLLGAFSAWWTTASANHNRVAEVQFAADGATANQRGARIDLLTKSNASTVLTRRWSVRESGHFTPGAANTYDIGSASLPVANIYLQTCNLSGAEYHTGEQSVSLTANTDNQTVNTTTRILRVDSNGAYNLTGLTGGAAGRRLTFLNVSAFTITLTHDATSTAANRFFCPNNASVLVRQNGSVEIVYDATSSRWRVIGA